VLKDLGLQNDGLTVWSEMRNGKDETGESHIDADTKLEKGFEGSCS
jgi:hypothetical protein